MPVLTDVLMETRIKCPYSLYSHTVTQAYNDPSELVEGKPKLKQDHEYMYQIQGQLGIKWCDLMVWLGFLPAQMDAIKS